MAKKSKGLPVASSKPVPVKIVSEGGVKVDEAQEKRWRAQSDMDAIKRAEEIKKDKVRMKALKDFAKEQMKELKKIC